MTQRIKPPNRKSSALPPYPGGSGGVVNQPGQLPGEFPLPRREWRRGVLLYTSILPGSGLRRSDVFIESDGFMETPL